MPEITAQAFNEIASGRGNAEIYLDSRDDQLRFGRWNNGSIMRIVTWIGSKLGHSGAIRHQNENLIRHQNETFKAYVEFTNALGKDGRYADQVGWVRSQLDTDMAAYKPLTVRKVRQVMSALNAGQAADARNDAGQAADARNDGSSVEAAADNSASVSDYSSFDHSIFIDHDPTHIGRVEVRKAMRHLLLSDMESRDGGGAPNIQKVDILHAKMDFRGKSLNEEEIRCISDYIANSDINRHLGPNGGDPSKLSPRYLRQYNGMQSGLEKLPDERSIVYRGTTTSRSTIDRFSEAVGERFTSTAFLSTSASPNFAKAFSNPQGVRNQSSVECDVRYQILGHTGKNIAGIEDMAEGLEDPADYLGNGEVLFRPGTTFRLVAFAKHPDKEVYGIVLKEVATAPIGPEPTYNLQDVERVPAKTAVDGLTDDVMAEFDKRLSDEVR